MARQAIRNEGAAAEKAFLDLVTNSRKSDSAKKGDAIVNSDGVDSYVEIKYVTSNTVNQVRAIKFIPLAIYSPQKADRPWAVLSAHEVVRLVVEKERGQHTEIALESAGLTLAGIPGKFRVRDSDLDDAIHTALRNARKYSLLAQTLADFLTTIRSANAGFREKIQAALLQGDAE